MKQGKPQALLALLIVPVFACAALCQSGSGSKISKVEAPKVRIASVSMAKMPSNRELARIKKGQVPEFDIPYEIEGTAWVTVESLGRLATSFGPAAGEWPLQR